MAIDGGSLQGAIEALLFVSDEPVASLAIASALDRSAGDVEEALRSLQKSLEGANRGIQLREVAGGWRLYTHPAYHDIVESYVMSWDTRRLSQASLETLAIIAYLQPVTRAGVAAVRGVNSDSSIISLCDKGLVREAGTADTPGNPMQYATTHAFLEKYGLRSVADLPPLESFAPDEETRALISDRLSVRREPLPEADEDGAIDLSTIEFELSDESESVLGEVFARQLGLVEKIDLDSLHFDFDE